MPLVTVRYHSIHDGAVLHDSMLESLGEAVATAVANRFDCEDEGGDLTSGDIEVYFVEASRFDKTDYQVIIDVEAKHYPSRHESKQERTDALRDDIRQMLPSHISFGLWVKLNNAAWADAPAGPGLGAMMENASGGESERSSAFPGHHQAHSLG